MEYIILYVIITCVALVIATLARMSTVLMGYDGFTAFMVFIIVLVILAVVHLSIHVVLQNLMLPWIGNGLAKIPYFHKKIEQRQVSIIEEGTLIEEVEVAEKETYEFPDTPERPSIKDIRNEQLQIKVKEQEEKLNIALNYTWKSFVLYLSDKDLNILCRNMQIYIDKMDVAGLQPVKVKELTSLDLRHFGWNIWNYFKPRGQDGIASFLKTVFLDIFRETEVKSIKRHLKDDELKGIIKIQEKLDKSINE